jgi:hypothetical protein
MLKYVGHTVITVLCGVKFVSDLEQLVITCEEHHTPEKHKHSDVEAVPRRNIPSQFLGENFVVLYVAVTEDVVAASVVQMALIVGLGISFDNMCTYVHIICN